MCRCRCRCVAGRLPGRVPGRRCRACCRAGLSARTLPSLPGRGVCVCVCGGGVFPVTLACSPAHSWPEKALGRYRQGEGKAAGPQEMPWRGHSQEYPEVGEQAMVTDWRGWPRGVQSLWAAELPGEGSLPQGRASTGRLASPGPSAEPQLGRGFSPERGPYVGGGVMMAATRGARARPEHQGGQEP